MPVLFPKTTRVVLAASSSGRDIRYSGWRTMNILEEKENPTTFAVRYRGIFLLKILRYSGPIAQSVRAVDS